ncbi:MAG TPA: UGSC family (seleno)protein, partial [Lacipirellulaceae bacterium]|nr:UGSC family (seleno)protein [Lacipirellulaceae bacterium]
MIAAGSVDKDLALGVMPPLNGVAAIEKIAANAVMAGCLPEYFPLVIAAVKGVLKPGFNLDGVQTTTGNVAPVIVVNGPCRKSLQINCGANALGQGWRANATIGRALRLIMTNIGGATPGVLD